MNWYNKYSLCICIPSLSRLSSKIELLSYSFIVRSSISQSKPDTNLSYKILEDRIRELKIFLYYQLFRKTRLFYKLESTFKSLCKWYLRACMWLKGMLYIFSSTDWTDNVMQDLPTNERNTLLQLKRVSFLFSLIKS